MIKHGVKEEVERDEELKEYLAVCKMDENTVEEVFSKWSLLASLNPEHQFAWNILKLFMLKLEGELNYKMDQKYSKYKNLLENDELEDVSDFEKKYVLSQDSITITGIQNNCKSYAVWNHRKYIYRYINKERDYKLCKRLFEMDPRNFHCWNYSRSNGYSYEMDLMNPSSLKCTNVSKMVAIDPGNRAYWELLQVNALKKEAFYLKLHQEYAKIIFMEPFKGRIVFGEREVAVNWTKCVKLDYNGPFNQDTILGKKEGEGSMAEATLNLNQYSFKQIDEPSIVSMVLELEPSNCHALKTRAFFKNDRCLIAVIKS
ncbi:hypothetical protein ECANGB1_1566 [Enterospora canceri]|uniref:Geranylgeranyl transferase type-2 subunit alpha n=1 Tax=Enterospora canceri TaxID=1081671 RepID=A0A1Y1S5R9_9MICR|nr:hypothetical protein ECANGB1_1566 [Enterospora canceri]